MGKLDQMAKEADDGLFIKAAKYGVFGPIGMLIGGNWDSISQGAGKLWDDLVIALKGKKVVVIGQRRVGKTHLLKFLHSGSIPGDEYKQTMIPRNESANRLQLSDLKLDLKSSKDIGGDEPSYPLWRDLVLGADVVLYLVRADSVMVEDAVICSRAISDLKQISKWLSERKTKPEFFVVGTHADMDDSFDGGSHQGLADCRQRFIESHVVRDLIGYAGGGSDAKVAVGSLLTNDSTANLVKQIFLQVES